MKVVAEIKIQLLENGQVSVDGPIHDKILSFGLLACAHEAVCDYNANAEQSAILQVKRDILKPVIVHKRKE